MLVFYAVDIVLSQKAELDVLLDNTQVESDALLGNKLALMRYIFFKIKKNHIKTNEPHYK